MLYFGKECKIRQVDCALRKGAVMMTVLMKGAVMMTVLKNGAVMTVLMMGAVMMTVLMKGAVPAHNSGHLGFSLISGDRYKQSLYTKGS